MIEIKINTVELSQNDHRVLVEELKELIGNYNAGFVLDSKFDDIQLPIDPIGEALDEHEDQYIDKSTENAAYLPSTEMVDEDLFSLQGNEEFKGEITEDEYNDLFQQDRKDQFNELDKEIKDRSDYYQSDRPVDP